MPYLIDNHIHGSFGVNFNCASCNEIKFVLKEFYKRNIKGICPTLVGDEDDKIYNQLKLFKLIRQEQLKECNSEALILGVHLEGTFLNSEKSGIQDKKVFKSLTVEVFKSLVKDCEDVVKIVTLAPEKDIDLVGYLLEKNIKVQLGHSMAESMGKIKATTHHFNAMPQIHHRSPSATLEALVNDEIYCEIIPDLIHCSKEMLKLFLKAKPKDKILLISDSLPSSNYDKDIIFCNKKINKFGKDEKGTLAGSNKTLDEICQNLINEKILTKDDVAKMGFENQIKYLNLSNYEVDILNR